MDEEEDISKLVGRAQKHEEEAEASSADKRPGIYAKAAIWYGKAVRVAEKHMTPEDEDYILEVRDLWATNLQDAGDHNAVLACDPDTVERHRSLHGDKHKGTLEAQRRLGHSYLALGRYHDASRMFKRVVHARPVVAKNMKGICDDRSNLAVALFNCNTPYSVAEAVDVSLITLGMAKSHFGEENIQTCTILYNVAIEFHRLGKYEEALERLESNLEILSRETCGRRNNPEFAKLKADTERSLEACKKDIQTQHEAKEKAKREKEEEEARRKKRREARMKAEEDARKKKEEEEEARLKAEEDARKKKEEEARLKKKEEERIAKEEEARSAKEREERRKRVEARRKAQREEIARIQREEEARLAKEEEDAIRQAKELEEAIQRAKELEEAIQRAKEQEEAIQRAKEQEEAIQQAKEQEEAIQRAKEEEAIRLAKEEEEIRLAREKIEATERKAAQTRKRQEEEEYEAQLKKEKEEEETKAREAIKAKIREEQETRSRKQQEANVPTGPEEKVTRPGSPGSKDREFAYLNDFASTSKANKAQKDNPNANKVAEVNTDKRTREVEAGGHTYDKESGVSKDEENVGSASDALGIQSESHPVSEELLTPTTPKTPSTMARSFFRGLAALSDATSKAASFSLLGVPTFAGRERSRSVGSTDRIAMPKRENLEEPLASDCNQNKEFSKERQPTRVERINSGSSSKARRRNSLSGNVMPGEWHVDFDEHGPVQDIKDAGNTKSTTIKTNSISPSPRSQARPPPFQTPPRRPISQFFDFGLQSKADEWFSDLEDDVHGFLDKYRDFDSKSHGKSRKVKIALLDTGIAKAGKSNPPPPLIKQASTRIKLGKRVEKSLSIWEDTNGHGTHSAGLILRVCPYAELYVYRVLQGDEPLQHDLVAEALADAIDNKNVDIVSMSFGWDSDEHEGLRAVIDRAKSAKVLLFAASSNDGVRARRMAYPARADEVIAVDSADGYGSPSIFNPPESSKQRFTALGEAVYSAWPMALSEEGEEKGWKRMSGTSCATPIAAAIAGLILEFARQPPLCFDPTVENHLKTVTGMRAVFSRLLSKTAPNSSFQHLVPEELLSCHDDLDGGEWWQTYTPRSDAVTKILSCLRHIFSRKVGILIPRIVEEESARRQTESLPV